MPITSDMMHFTVLNCVMSIIDVNGLRSVSSGAPEFTKVRIKSPDVDKLLAEKKVLNYLLRELNFERIKFWQFHTFLSIS